MASTAPYPTATTLSGFLTVVLRIAGAETLLLRGNRCESWPLIPKLGRLPLRTGSTTEAEKDLVERFQSQSPPAPAPGPGGRVGLAGHGAAPRPGRPAPRLDLEPAGRLVVRRARAAHRAESGVVFVFAPEADDFANRGVQPYDVAKTTFFRPSHLNQRIVLQQGWFSVHHFSAKNNRFSTLCRVTAYKGRIDRVLIPGRCFASLRTDLNRVGINDATMFPDLDGLSRYLNWEVFADPPNEAG